jgi:hypothetical protein
MLDDYRSVLEPALDYSGGTHIWSDIVDGVSSGMMQLWVNGDSAAITQILTYPQKKVLNVFLAGGDKDDLLDMLDSAKMWGAQQGCESILMSGRPGWLKVLSKHDWKPLFQTMEARL